MLKQLFGGEKVVARLRGTSVYQGLQGGESGSSDNMDDLKNAKPSYMSARSFADATIEMLDRLKAEASTADVQPIRAAITDSPLGRRLAAIESEVGNDLTAAKADLGDVLRRQHATLAGCLHPLGRGLPGHRGIGGHGEQSERGRRPGEEPRQPPVAHRVGVRSRHDQRFG
jgi:hypothetical protein